MLSAICYLSGFSKISGKSLAKVRPKFTLLEKVYLFTVLLDLVKNLACLFARYLNESQESPHMVAKGHHCHLDVGVSILKTSNSDPRNERPIDAILRMWLMPGSVLVEVQGM